MLKFNRSLLFFVTFLVLGFSEYVNGQWLQREDRINLQGLNSNVLNNSVALSSDGSTMVAASDEKAIIYTFNGANFVKVQDLTGIGAIPDPYQRQSIGANVDISADGKTVIISDFNDNGGQGAIFVFTFNGTNYAQIQKLIAPDQSQDQPFFAYSIAISGDGNTIISGSSGYECTGYPGGCLGASWIFTFNGASFVQAGNLLRSTDAVYGSYEGETVDISYDGKTAIVGNAWGVHTYTFNGTNFQQLGGYIPSGQLPNIKMAADGHTFVIGGYSNGAEVYTFNGSFFVKFGATLIGNGQANAYSDQVNISADGMTILSSNGTDNGTVGAVWAFTFNGTNYVQAGCKIVGTPSYNSYFGTGIAISADGKIFVATGTNTDLGSTVAWVLTSPPYYIPTITGISPSAELFCSDHDYTITVSTTGYPDKFRWYKNGSLMNVNNSNTLMLENITSTVTGLYNCIVNYGCLEFTSPGVNINVIPSPTVLGSVFPSVVCYGETVTFSGAGASALSISGGAMLDLPFIPTITGFYTVTGLATNGCFQYLPLTVTVNQLPVISFSGKTSICIGETTDITVSGANTYLWDNGSTVPGLQVTPTSNAPYLITGTGITGCINTAMLTVTINSLPVVSISGSNVICKGDFALITASGANNYLWSNGTNNRFLTDAPQNSNTYIVTGTGTNGCTNTATAIVTVNSLPIVVISGNNSICKGDATILNVMGGNSYQWSNNITDAMITVSPDVNTIYSVSGIGSNGCIGSSQLLVNVKSIPVLSITGKTDLCKGSLTTISVLGANTNTYLWSHGSNKAAIVVDTDSSKTYIVTGTGINGCFTITSQSITIHSPPEISLDLSSINNICDTLSPTQLTGGLPTGGTYWYANKPVINLNTSAAGSYLITYQYKDAFGCVNTTSGILTSVHCTVPSICERPIVPCYCTNTCPPRFKIYTGITPNGDGYNDTWLIDSLYIPNQVTILDKWGYEVYKTENYLQDWDGTKDGKQLPPGIYYYVLEAGSDRKRTSGTVTIIR